MLVLIALLALGATPAILPPPPEIELITIGPGPAYWERFGHNMIVVRYPDGGPAIAYNYGIFDFGQRNFLLNFLRGRMSYRLAGLDPDRDVADYIAADRSVVAQTLALDDGERRRLAAFLERNRQPENASYRYDYFLANCSTKVRDALDQVLGGGLADSFADQPTEHSFREFTNRYAAPVPWMYVGTQLGLGRPTDRPISRWETFFIPEQLRLGLEQVTVRDARGRSRKLVSASRQIHLSDRYSVPAAAPQWIHWFLLVGLVIAAPIGLAGPALRRWLAGAWWGGCSLVGTLMLLVWAATDHQAAYANENLLIFSPLCLLGTLALRGPVRRRGIVRLAAVLILIPLLAALVLPATGLLFQHNLEFLAFAMPIHAAAAAALVRRGRRGGFTPP